MVRKSSHPQRITHPFDKNHVLSLTSAAGSSYSCNACGGTVYDCCYSCRACNIDLHTHCASMPLTRTHHSHPHGLTLAFSVPYPSKCFTCNLCRVMGSGQWLYRCDMCSFDAHLGCAGMEQGQGHGPYQVHARHQVVQTPQPPVQVQHYQYQVPLPSLNPNPYNVANSSYVMYHAAAPARPSMNTAAGGVLGTMILSSAIGGTFQALGSGLTNLLFGDGGGGHGGGDGGGDQTDFGAVGDLGGF